MKNRLITGFTACAFALGAMAQEEMSTTWMKNPDHKIVWKGKGEQVDVIYTASKKEMTVYNPTTGDMTWTKEFKTMAPKFKSVDEIIPMWDAKVFFIFNRRGGLGSLGFGIKLDVAGDMLVVADMKTGEPLWSSEEFDGITDENVIYVPEAEAFMITTKKALHFIKARTGQKIWETSKFGGVVGDYYVDVQEGTMTMLNYKPTSLASLFSLFKNQIMKVNLKNGDVIWDQTYRGVFEKKVYTGEPLARIIKKENKIFLTLNGLQVFEYSTGKVIWSAAYDETPKVKAVPMDAVQYGIYGAVADPVVVGDYIYILDMQNKRKQYIKKYELESGKLIWTSPEIPDARAIPNMYEINGVIVLQVGGTVEEQGYYKRVTRNTDGSTTISYFWEKDYIEVKPFNVQGFDANSGKALWESERFKKGITNLFPDGNDVIVCSGKALYRLDAKTGADKYEIDISKDGVSQANKILEYNDNVVIVCDKGVTIHKKSDGSLIKSAKYKKALPVEVKNNNASGGITSGKSGINKLSGMKGDTYSQIVGNSLAMQTKGGDIAVYNLDNCVYRQIDARKDADLLLSQDGEYVFVFESGGTFSKSKITKYKTKP